MIPVGQRLFFDAETGERGDCLKCCMASLLELDYDDVPHFASMGDRWWVEWTSWLAERGWRLGRAWYTLDEDDPTKLSGYTMGYWLASVLSPRIVNRCETCGGQGHIATGEPGVTECVYCKGSGSVHGAHMIVMEDNRVAWDPHPQRDMGHLGFIQGELLVPIDPARFVLKDAA